MSDGRVPRWWNHFLPNLGNVVSELRRRHVFKVAAGYLIVGWIIIQAAEILVPNLLLPEWLTRAIIVLVLLGFPVALVLAWAYDLTPEGIQFTARRPSEGEASSAAVAAQKDTGVVEAGTEEGSQEDPEPGNATPARVPRPLPMAFKVLGPAILVSLLVAVGWFALRGPATADLPTGDALLERMQTLSDTGEYGEAFALAGAVRAEGEEIPESILAQVADRLTVITDPAGAQVLARRLTGEESETGAPTEWTSLGATPLRGVLLPRGDHLLRIQREGRVTLERIASTALMRSGVPPETVPETSLHLKLLLGETVPGGMVFVPGGPYAIASRNLQGLLTELDDFFLDHHEVSNERFAEFVEAGGYHASEHWASLFGDEDIPDADPVLRRMVDRTGLPGPRGWSGQRYAEDQGSHPVTGVSWFEAEAYCSFRDRRLPTFFEWEKAARDGWVARYAGVYMPWGYLAPGRSTAGRANFSGSGTRPVGSYPFGISAYGAYDMAGNVKEWQKNRTETGRAVTGGSWEDPIHIFAEVGSLAPESSSRSLGFRCARRVERSGASRLTQGDEVLPTAVETPEYEPVEEALFPSLLAHYAYDRRPVRGEIVEQVESGGWVRERILFDGPGAERVIGYLYLPSAGRVPYQTLVYVPGSGTFFGVSVPETTEWLMGPLIRSGRAVFSVVMEGMTERPWSTSVELPEPHTVRFRDLMVRHATEMRMGIDYLETRDDLRIRDEDGAGAVGYVGMSWGAGSRLVFAAVDDRFASVILIGGGIDERVQSTLSEASNINFAPRIRVPTLLLNGREDEEHPWPTRALPLWELLTEPKELVLIDGVGHVPPAADRVPPMLDFLDRTLGPVRR